MSINDPAGGVVSESLIVTGSEGVQSEESPPSSPPSGGGGETEPVDEGVFPTLANVIDSFDTVRFANKIHAICQERVTGRSSYSVFDMATEVWETVNQQIIASNSHGDTGCTICVLSSGEPVVIFMGDRVAKGPGPLVFDGMNIAGAGDYQRAYISRREAGVWTTPEIVATPDDLVGTFYPEGLNYQGYVNVRVGRLMAEADDWARTVFTVDVPGDVANTPELYTQRLRPDKTLTTTDKVKLALSTWYTTTHVVGQPCVFEYEGTAYTAVPVGFTHHPKLFIWEGTGTPGPDTREIDLVDDTTAVQVQPDSFCTLNPPISAHFFKDKIRIVMGTRKASTNDWVAYKTISPPFTTLDPNPLSEPRNDQAGPTWPGASYARQGVEFATILGRDYLFKVSTGNFGVPSSSKKSILEKMDLATDIPGDTAYTVAQFLLDNA